MSEPADKLPPAQGYATAFQQGTLIGHVNHVSPLQMISTPSTSVSPPGSPSESTDLAPAALPASGKGAKKGRPKASVEELAAARKAKQRATARVARAVDYYMDQAHRTSVVVPWIYVYVAGSLGAASALQQIQAESERCWHENNAAWVSLEPLFWHRRTGLNQDGWVQARQRLREIGLIEERSRFDPNLNQIITEIQWLPQAYCDACAKVRADMRADLREALESGVDIDVRL